METAFVTETAMARWAVRIVRFDRRAICVEVAFG